MLPLFSNQQLPANAGIFYKSLMDIASFDLLPTDKFYEKYFEFDDDFELVDPKFETVGYESQYFMINTGTLLVSLLSISVLVMT